MRSPYHKHSLFLMPVIAMTIAASQAQPYSENSLMSHLSEAVNKLVTSKKVYHKLHSSEEIAHDETPIDEDMPSLIEVIEEIEQDYVDLFWDPLNIDKHLGIFYDLSLNLIEPVFDGYFRQQAHDTYKRHET